MLFTPFLLQRINGEDRLSLAGQEPVSQQLISVNLDPGLHQAQLVGLEFAASTSPSAMENTASCS